MVEINSSTTMIHACVLAVLVISSAIYTFEETTTQLSSDLDLGCYRLLESNLKEIHDSHYPPGQYDGQTAGYGVTTAFTRCRNVCSQNRKTYFAIKRNGISSDFARCYCGDNITGQPVSENQCSYLCQNILCGGIRGHVSLYSVCRRSYYTTSCEEICHCAEGTHCSLQGLCPNGCHTGWTGAYCHLDVDECEMNNDDCSQVCLNTGGSYTCHCRPGYAIEADNTSCTDMDECAVADACRQGKEDCWNSPGSYTCCPIGTNYDKNGDLCEVPNKSRYITWIAVGSTAAGVLLIVVAVLAMLLYRTRKPGTSSATSPPTTLTTPVQPTSDQSRPDSVDMAGYTSVLYNQSPATRQLPPTPLKSTAPPRPDLHPVTSMYITPPAMIPDTYLTPPGLGLLRPVGECDDFGKGGQYLSLVTTPRSSALYEEPVHSDKSGGAVTPPQIVDSKCE